MKGLTKDQQIELSLAYDNLYEIYKKTLRMRNSNTLKQGRIGYYKDRLLMFQSIFESLDIRATFKDIK